MNSAGLADRIPGFTKRTLQMFARSLERELREPSPAIALDVIERTMVMDLQNVDARRIQRRLSNGCRLFIALHEKNPIGYVFTATSRCYVDEVEQEFKVMPGECYLFDAFTYPAYRGHGVYPSLLMHTARFFQSRAFRHALIFTTGRNRSSVRGIRKAGFTCYGTVKYYQILGHRFWKYQQDNGHIKSHFNDRV